MTFGERLKLLIEERGMDQRKFAETFNLSPSTVSGYVTNYRSPNDDLKKKFADYFLVSVDYLLGCSDIRNIEATLLSNKASDMLIHKDIEEYMQDIEEKLLNSDGLMINDESASPEAIRIIVDAMKIGLEMAKKRNRGK